MADELEKLYNYGQRGIDTQIERDIINYDPVLQYIKGNVIKEGYKINDNYVPSSEMDFMVKNNIPNAKAALAQADNAIQICLKTLKDKLKDIKVEINDLVENKNELIRKFCGISLDVPKPVYLTFDMFDKACRDGSPEARTVMLFYMEKTSLVEALAYPDVIMLDKDTKQDITFVDRDCTELAYAHGYDQNKPIEDATSDMIGKRYELETRKQELESLFDNELGTDEDFDEYQQVTSDLNDLNRDTVPTISNLVIDRADASYRDSLTIYGLTVSEIADIIGNDGQLDGLIMAIGTTDPYDPMEEVAKIRKQVANLKKIVAVANALSSMKAIDLTGLIMMLLSPILKEVTNQLISTISRVKISLIKPTLDWLDKLSDKASFIPMKNTNISKTGNTTIDKSIDYANTKVNSFTAEYQKISNLSQAVDKVANIIIDVANDIESKFDDYILDYYKATQARSDKLAEKFQHLKKKKWAEAIDKVLDTILICLDASTNAMTFNSLDSVKSYVDRVKEKLDWGKSTQLDLNVPDILAEWTAPVVDPIVEELQSNNNATDPSML